MKKNFLILAVIFVFFFSLSAQVKKSLQPEDLYKIKVVSEVQISPDGKWIAYTQSITNLEKNESNSDIWLLPIAGGIPRQLTNSPKNDSSPRWSPDGKQIAFISKREGVNNIYLISVTGGEAQKLTKSKTDLSSPIWSRDGKFILCQSRVLPENKKSTENWTEKELDQCKARTINGLLFRQWDRWLGDKRNHLFLANVSDGSLRDLTPADADVPPISLESNHDFDISPDGKEICFVRNDDPVLALSTNQDIFTLDLETGKETKITQNQALDNEPHYSPDGKYIAYKAMQKPGYEADCMQLMVYHRIKNIHIPLTASLDYSVEEILWSPNSQLLYFTCLKNGRRCIYCVDLKANLKLISDDGYNKELAISPKGNRLVFVKSYNHMPYEIFSLSVKEKKKTCIQLSFANKDFMTQFDLPKLEDFWFKGAEGIKVHGFLLKPPGFDPQKKYPVVLVIHGGPQNMWADRFMTGWFTFQLVSSPGYVGLFIDPRGSDGYGSGFREKVSRNYGDQSYIDLMKGLDYALEKFDFIDDTKQAVMGGSYGGYMGNWINGHTNRFKCIISHAGVFNLVSFFGATEELWYPKWDMGKSPWEEPQLYQKWSPHLHVKNFKTPTLVIHGEKDFRVPFAESLQLFTALQLQKIPSRLVVFPDEGHVIENPQNNVRWWLEMHRWLKEYLKD